MNATSEEKYKNDELTVSASAIKLQADNQECALPGFRLLCIK